MEGGTQGQSTPTHVPLYDFHASGSGMPRSSSRALLWGSKKARSSFFTSSVTCAGEAKRGHEGEAQLNTCTATAQNKTNQLGGTRWQGQATKQHGTFHRGRLLRRRRRQDTYSSTRVRARPLTSSEVILAFRTFARKRRKKNPGQKQLTAHASWTKVKGIVWHRVRGEGRVCISTLNRYFLPPQCW